MDGSISAARLGRLVGVIVVTATLVVWAGCAGDEGGGASGQEDPSRGVGSEAPTASDAVDDLDVAGSGDAGRDPSVTDADRPGASYDTGSTGVPLTDPPSTEELGVPGLDSDEVVCRAWSRFAGSFQVVAVAAAFGEGGSREVAELEVLASPIVVTAYDELLEAWPDELESERAAVAESFLGPFARRAERARDALLAAGAGPDDLAVATEMWLDVLATRDPSSAVPVVVLPDPVAALVGRASAAFDDQVPPVSEDPSLVTEVEIPLTQAFLVATCPDRGALGGTEVEAAGG